MIDGVFAYPILTAALFYLGARAVVTTFLWSKYPPKLDAFMSCAACSGFWYGLACASVGWLFDVPFIGSTSALTVPVVGLMSMVWTPFIAAKHEDAMKSLYAAGPADPWDADQTPAIQSDTPAARRPVVERADTDWSGMPETSETRPTRR